MDKENSGMVWIKPSLLVSWIKIVEKLTVLPLLWILV